MPHLGQLPGLSETTSGCIGHVYLATACVVAGKLVGVKRGAEGAAFSPAGIMVHPRHIVHHAVLHVLHSAHRGH